jgi:hypothetical protein
MPMVNNMSNLSIEDILKEILKLIKYENGSIRIEGHTNIWKYDDCFQILKLEFFKDKSNTK